MFGLSLGTNRADSTKLFSNSTRKKGSPLSLSLHSTELARPKRLIDSAGVPFQTSVPVCEIFPRSLSPPLVCFSSLVFFLSLNTKNSRSLFPSSTFTRLAFCTVQHTLHPFSFRLSLYVLLDQPLAVHHHHRRFLQALCRFASRATLSFSHYW